MNDQTTTAPPGCAPTNGSGAGVPMTKEMWTVVLAEDGGWRTTDIFSDTKADAAAVLDLIRRNAGRDIRPERWSTEGAKVTRCVVSIYPPNDKSSDGSEPFAATHG